MNRDFVTASHIMCYLTLAQKEVFLAPSDRIGIHLTINAADVRRITGFLQQKELIVNIKGPGGGYRLAKSAELISLREIYEAVEEPDADFWNIKKMALKSKKPASNITGVHKVLDAKFAQAKEDMLHSLSLVSLLDVFLESSK